MPYATPTATTTAASPPLPTHSLGRPGHRRSYSSERFTDERGPGAFQSLGALPKRQPATTPSYKPPISVNTQKRFHLKPESSSSSSDEDDDDGPPPPLKLKTPLSPSFGVGVPFPRSSPRNSPRSSPLSSPLPADPNLLSPLSGTGLSSLPINSLSITNEKYLAPPSRPSPNRTTSSPILLSNGKPLKSSLKSSSSTSNIPATHPTSHSHPHHPHAHHSHHHSHAHIRARSAPSTPSLATDSTSTSTSTGSSPTQSTPATPKNVHFPSLPNDLEHIRIFNRSAKPSSLRRSSDASRGPTGAIIGAACEETETETETDREGWVGGYLRSSVGFAGAVTAPASSSSSSSSGFPFPKFPSPPQTPETSAPETTFVLDTEGYTVPSPSTSRDQYANILLEKLVLSTDNKLALEGTLLVRNIAFEKQVYLRFTLDEWATVSEVAAKYEASLTLPSLTSLPGRTLGDVIASASASSSSGLGAHGRSFSESALNRGAGKTEMINWDRFSFSINLSDFARLEERTMWAVGRYVVPGKGEWWDNNGGRNFRVGWKKVPVVKKKKQEKEEVKNVKEKEVKEVEVKDRERKEGRSLSAPAAPVVVPNVTTTAPSPPPPKTTFATATATAPTHSPPTSPTSREQTTAALTAATSARLSKFSLKNYVAPGSPAAVRSRSGSLGSLSSSTTSTTASTEVVVEKKVEVKVEEVKKPSEVAEEPQVPLMKRENKPSFSGMGIGLYWPWGSNSSSSTNSTSTNDKVKAGGSASVVVVPSPKGSPTPKAEQERKEFFPVPVPVPALEKDGGTSSTSGSSESLDSLMSSSFSTTTYMPRLNVKELEYGYQPGGFNGLTVGESDLGLGGVGGVGVYNAYDGGFIQPTHEPTKEKDSRWAPPNDPDAETEEDITETEADTETERDRERTPKLSPNSSDSPVPSPPSFSSSVTSSTTSSSATSSPVLMSPTALPFSPRAGTDDSLYKAFVKQWCFGGVGVEVGR